MYTTSGLIKVVVKGSLLGQNIRNIYTFEWTDPLGANVIETDITGYLDDIYTPLLGNLVNDLTFSDYDVYKWVSPNWSYLGSIPWSQVGTDTQDPLPNQMAAVILGKVLGRRGFGRKFFAGISEGAQSGGTLIGSLVTTLVGVATAYITPHGGGAIWLTPGVIDSAHNFHAFTSGVVDVLLGSMRRRKIGVGF